MMDSTSRLLQPSGEGKSRAHFKQALKKILGELPFTAEVYWYLRQSGQPLTASFSLARLQQALPGWVTQVEAAAASEKPGKKVLVFGTLRYWIEHVTLLGLAFAGLGHRVTLAYLPYARWFTPNDRFNARRNNLYALKVLEHAKPWLQVVPLLTTKKVAVLPDELNQIVQRVSWRDTQYTLQVEDVPPDSELCRLRLERNEEAARAALALMQSERPDILVVPNGTILEFGTIYQVARYLNIPAVTYEFGEQRERIWLAQNAEVMRQETEALWQVRKESPLSDEQLIQARSLFASRQRASLWENFARRWQGVPSEGGERVRAALDLDHRPVVLLATNVIGDSLTLGRQVFSDSMTEWLQRTVQYFSQRPDVQFVARIHPGELITKGPSVADVVQRMLPELPEHIHLVPADAKVNTYDLVEIADLGLVYTTTVGLEMAMSGTPVIVVGNTHYRAKGFTLDPHSWEEYFEILSRALLTPGEYRLTQEQVAQAWNYAYRFFFEYPHPFPWHLLHFWEDVETWPLARVFCPEGQERFGNTLKYLLGDPVDWMRNRVHEG